MMFLHHQRSASVGLGSGLLFNGLLCIFFAIAIFSAPELLAYFIAMLLLIIGVSLLTTWWKIRNAHTEGKRVVDL